jgi:hypothetical protein
MQALSLLWAYQPNLQTKPANKKFGDRLFAIAGHPSVGSFQHEVNP